MPIPIAYVAGSFPKRSETFVYRELRELRRRGWDVTAISLNDPEARGLPEFADLENGNITVYGSSALATFGAAMLECITHPIRSTVTYFTAACDAIAPGEPLDFISRVKLLGQAMAAIGAARRLAGATPPVTKVTPAVVKVTAAHIHAHFAHAPATIAMYIAKHLKIPFSFTGHANDLFQRRALLKRKLERAVFVACISEWHRNFYIEAGADPAKCHVIRCGVPVHEWKAREANDNRQRIQLLTVCRLVEKKGVDTLLRATVELSRELAADAIELEVVIAGDGPESDKLRSLASELRIADRCKFLGAVSNDRVRELLMQADYFVLPCRTDSAGDRDGIPVVLMEAMACGVPVVSGDLPAIRELISHGESGMLVDGNNATDVANGIAELSRDPVLRSRVAQGGRKRVETEFSLEENVSRLERLLTR